LINPQAYKHPYPPVSTDWSPVTETFTVPANAADARLMISTKPGVIVEVTDLMILSVP